MDQNKIIAGAAKATLAPLGLSRKGRSRLWYDDHGFWAVVVEFQPSGWDRGTYLNVGLTWLFNSDTWSFNIGYREGEFLAAEKSAAFEQGINQTAEKAAALVQNYRNTFSSLPKMYAHYQKLPRRYWDSYYAGILAGLFRRPLHARVHFNEVLGYPVTAPWQLDVQRECRQLATLVGSDAAFRRVISQKVAVTRQGRGLPLWPEAELFPR